MCYCVPKGETCIVRHVSGKLSDRHHIWEYQESGTMFLNSFFLGWVFSLFNFGSFHFSIFVMKKYDSS